MPHTLPKRNSTTRSRPRRRSTRIKALENEAIHIFREAEFESR